MIPALTLSGIVYADTASYPTDVFFGDTHVHTGWSADAGLDGAVKTPDEAYRLAIGEEVVLRPSQIKWRKERDRRNLERKRERARWKREEKLARKREKEMEDYYREKERRELEEKMKTHEVKEFVDLDGYKFAAWIPKDRSNRKALEDALLEGLGIHKESINKVKMFEKLEKELTNGNC